MLRWLRFIRKGGASRWTIKLPWRRGLYLSINLTGQWELPQDANSRALDMLCGRRPADADLLARLWFREVTSRSDVNRAYEAKIRLLERKINAQRAELRRKALPSTGPTDSNG